MNMKTFDLIIIGGGAGAFAAAIRANELKAKTALVNAGLPLGGIASMSGAFPQKRFFTLARFYITPNITALLALSLK